MLYAGKGLLLLLGILVIVATGLPLLRAEAWWVRIFDFPRVQILILGTAVLLLCLLWLRPLGRLETGFVVILAAALFYQGRCILPYTRLAGEQVLDASSPREERTLRLLVANVLMTNRNDRGLLRLVAEARPDVVLAVETDRWWEERLRTLEAEFPFVLRQPQDNTYGLLLYSRFELDEKDIHFLVKEDIPSCRVQLRLPSGDSVDLWGVHPEPPSPTENDSSVPRDAELLLVGKAVRDISRPVVVAGDLNDVAWSRTTRLFQKISGLLDPRIGRGRFSTFHVRYPLFRWPLDHVFHSDHFRLVELRVLPDFGSDHFPILAVLSFEPQTPGVQEKPEADREEREEAREKIDKGIEEGRDR